MRQTINFKVNAFRINPNSVNPYVNIEGDDLFYGGDKTGHGIQVNNKNQEKSLLKMCDKINNAVQEYLDES